MKPETDINKERWFTIKIDTTMHSEHFIADSPEKVAEKIKVYLEVNRNVDATLFIKEVRKV